MTPDNRPASGREQVMAEHREIVQLTQQLAEARDRGALTRCLKRLHTLLEQHFDKEENEIDGLHDAIRSRTPEHHNDLLALKDEHTALLQRMEQLLAAEDADIEVLRNMCRQLRDELEAHEFKETGLFLDSIWTDLGGGD